MDKETRHHIETCDSPIVECVAKWELYKKLRSVEPSSIGEIFSRMLIFPIDEEEETEELIKQYGIEEIDRWIYGGEEMVKL